MTGANSYGNGSINTYANWLWAYTGVVMLLSGLAFSAGWAGYDEYTGTMHWSGTGLLIGLAAGAFSTVPFWILFGVAAHIARRLDVVQSGYRSAIATAARTATVDAPVPVAAGAPSLPDAAVAGDADVAALLADPAIREQVEKARRSYGRKVAAQVLTRKAHEAGVTDAEFTEDDLPADL